KIIFITKLVLIFSVCISCRDNYVLKEGDSDSQIINQEFAKIDWNKFDFHPTSTKGQVVNHTYYTLSYNEKHEQAEWVAYELKSGISSYSDFKRPYFIEDPKVKTRSADWRNYKNSGYDKG